jgi:hypothetical protein
LIAERTASIVFQEGTTTMQAPQNFASAHRAPAGGATQSTRAAVQGIFHETDAFLGGFRTAFSKDARARHKEANGLMKNLRRSVQDMLAAMRRDREEATNATREQLSEYMADLQASVAGAKLDADEQLQEISRLRHEAAREFALIRAEDHDALCGNGRQELERLAEHRRDAARSLHSELDAFAAELETQVAQTRKQFRQELGFEEPRAKAKPRRMKASKPHARKAEPPKETRAEPQKKSAPRMAKAHSKAPKAPAKQAAPAQPARQAKQKKTVKAAARAPSRKHRVH